MRDDTPWDRGEPSPQAQAWIDSGVVKAGDRIVVPGCGSGWELATFAAAGLDVVGVDFAPAAVERAGDLLHEAGLPGTVFCADVLVWGPGAAADAVYEQTCLCALHPDDWTTYVDQLRSWLRPGGVLLAHFMQAADLWANRSDANSGRIYGPPFHCDITAMRALFAAPAWKWPAPPYPLIDHGMGTHELAVPLRVFDR